MHYRNHRVSHVDIPTIGAVALGFVGSILVQGCDSQPAKSQSPEPQSAKTADVRSRIDQIQTKLTSLGLLAHLGVIDTPSWDEANPYFRDAGSSLGQSWVTYGPCKRVEFEYVTFGYAAYFSENPDQDPAVDVINIEMNGSTYIYSFNPSLSRYILDGVFPDGKSFEPTNEPRK